MIADSLIWWNDPATWPWMFHTRATFALARIIRERHYERQRAVQIGI
jgi:hypothetical protein